MTQRQIEPELSAIIKNPISSGVIIIEGARQVGKTALINDILAGQQDVIKINFETERVLS